MNALREYPISSFRKRATPEQALDWLLDDTMLSCLEGITIGTRTEIDVAEIKNIIKHVWREKYIPKVQDIAKGMQPI